MRHWLLLAGAFAVAVVLSKLLVEDVLGLEWTAVMDLLVADPGPASAGLIVLLLSVDIFLPVPSSVIMVLSGFLFGVVKGGMLALVGSLAGNYVGFELTRAFGRRAARWLVGDAQLEDMNRAFSRRGAMAIALSRPLPIVMETLSLVAGLSSMTRSTFLAASLVGTTPIAFVYAYAGVLSLETGTIVPAAVILVAVVTVTWVFVRPRLRARRRPSSSYVASPD